MESGDTEDITSYDMAALALARIGEPALEPLRQALMHENDNIRLYSAKALGEMGDPRGVASLVAALDDPDSLVRDEAAEALGKIRDDHALRPLQETLANDPDEYVRHRAARALGKFVFADVRVALYAALREPSEVVRSGAIWSLTEAGGTRVIDTLVGLLQDPEPCIRSTAVICLGQVGGVEALSALEQLEHDEAHCGANCIRITVASAIEEILRRT